MLNFTKHKFLDFPLRQQHKKSGELLRNIYDQLLLKIKADELIQHYDEIQGWMGLQPLSKIDFKLISDRYHHHLESALVNIRENNLLPSVKTRDKANGAPLLPIAIYLDRLRSAFNVGSIIRTTEAMALGSVYFADKTPFIDNRQVQNTSMDASRWIPCHRGVTLDQLPKPIIVMETSSEAISLHEFIFPETFTLVMGNEEYGCSDESLRQADYIVEIPLYGKKNSLNVANAFAIVAAEIQRQRKGMMDEKNNLH